MINWHEVEYEQISSDWRHRDNLTWQIPSILVVVGGALVAGAFGLDIDPCWVKIIRPLLLLFGAFFSVTLDIALVQNLRYQIASGKALEKLANGEGDEILEAGNKIRRTLRPKDLKVSMGELLSRLFKGLLGSILLLLLCFFITSTLIWLFFCVTLGSHNI